MQKGLNKHEVAQQKAKYGTNEITSDAKFSAAKLFLNQLITTINAILLIAGLFSLFVGHRLDAFFIFVIIIINAFFGFIQEFRAQKSLEKLKEYTAPTARVIRDGKEEQISAELIVPEDIIVLSEGDRVPADGVVIDAAGMEVDESILTGESMTVSKNLNDMLLMGTMLIKGNGMIKITDIGMQTKFGKIAGTLAEIKEDKAPLQKNLDKMGKYLSYAAVVIGLTIIPIGMAYGKELLPLLLTSASIGVAAIPEGLPAVVTMAFAVGMNRMVKRGAIVRKMTAIETLGSIQVLLSDKTGTMTQNVMRVKRYWLTKKEYMQDLIVSCQLGNTASLITKANGEYDIAGDQTDGALLLWTKSQEQTDLPKDQKKVQEHVFDSVSKTVTTVWEKTDKKYVYVRGAPEMLIEKCILTPTEKKNIIQEFETLAKEGLRIIGFGMKTIPLREKQTRAELEQDLTFLGFMCLYDPPRPEVKEAVRNSKQAGVHAIMVTGDNEYTALNIAKEIGLIEKDEDVITGAELDKMTDKEILEIILKTRVFARTKPEDKMRLVALLKKQGIVVGVTGDGVNDALALKKADVGIAMGKGGTDVAKEAADIVLTDNNFSTMIKAIEEGRIIYKNIANAIVYLISGNLAEISLVFFATLFNLPFPLLPTQILWVNIVTDSLPALALATGSRDETVLTHKPRDPKEQLLNKHRIIQIALIGFSMTIALMLIYVYLLSITQEGVARTTIFNLLVYFHLLFVFILGRQSLKKGNKFLFISILLILALQLMITYVPLFRPIFHIQL